MASPPQDRYDVVIAGGGPAGLAAGLFTARDGLRTLILDRGKSSLRQCAYLDNYLGFPGGIETPAFLHLAQAHAEDAGCELLKEKAEAVERLAGCAAPAQPRFRVHTHRGTTIFADRFVAASTYDAEYLRALNEPALFDEEGKFRREPIDEYGRTCVEGLYLAGPLAGVESQVLISAGQAARMALGLLRDAHEQTGLRQEASRGVDWLVWEGRYAGEQWERSAREHFQELADAHPELDPALVRDEAERWIRRKQAQQLTRDEVRQRSRRGRALRSHCLAQTVSAPRQPTPEEVDQT